jgi:hypothetical protein
MENILSKYLSPETVEKLLSGNYPDVPMRNRIIHLLLVQVEDDNLDGVEALITSASEILMQKDFTIKCVTSSLIVAFLGFPSKEPENPVEICRQTIGELTDNHRRKLKVLYANVPGRIGGYGHPKLVTFGPIVSKFDLILKQLVELNYGEFGEYRQP